MKIAVGLSGGVDSSVAAALLKKKGHDVLGLFMKVWDGTPVNTGGKHSCYGPDETKDIEDAKKAAGILDIPFYAVDISTEYKKEILGYFRDEYLNGRTPNPCVVCNRKIKFEKLVTGALESGIDFELFATGHYVRVEYKKDKDRYYLKRAKFTEKDQTYVLSYLTQKQLKRTIFPLGEFEKEKVREIAKSLNLHNFNRKESQDFYQGDYSELFKIKPKSGRILDIHGNVLGEHKGIWNYTIGQRKGLGVSSDRRLFVLEIDKNTNTVVLGDREYVYHDELTAGNPNWIFIENLAKPMKVKAKIRYTQKEAEAIITPLLKNKVHVKFREKQFGITPGQVAVFYKDDIVIGAGIIEKSKQFSVRFI